MDTSSSTSRRQARVQRRTDKNPPKNVSSTGENEVARQADSFLIVDLKENDIAEETMQYTQVNHMIEKLQTVNAQAEEHPKKAEFNFMVDLKTLIEKTLVDQKLLQMKICLRNIQKE